MSLALPSCFCFIFFPKLFNKIVYNRTVQFSDKFNLLYDGQCEFRNNRSTSVIDFTNKITDGFKDNLHSVGIFVDWSKAFDSTNHCILLDKLIIMVSVVWRQTRFLYLTVFSVQLSVNFQFI